MWMKRNDSAQVNDADLCHLNLEDQKVMSNSEGKREFEFNQERRRENIPVHFKSMFASANGLNSISFNKKPACYTELDEAVKFFGGRASSPELNISSITGQKCSKE